MKTKLIIMCSSYMIEKYSCRKISFYIIGSLYLFKNIPFPDANCLHFTISSLLLSHIRVFALYVFSTTSDTSFTRNDLCYIHCLFICDNAIFRLVQCLMLVLEQNALAGTILHKILNRYFK